MMLLAPLSDVGRDPAGGVTRLAWSKPELTLREWFLQRATELGLEAETDGNGNLWAWWLPSAAPALVIGSHLDSVPGGGEFDGPLGVASAFAAVDRLRSGGWMPRRPVAVVAFCDEEGGRFGVACLGSRMLTGAIPAERALALRDADGVSLAEAMGAAGHDPARAGADPVRVGRVGEFVELHIEQGRMPGPDGVRGLAGAGVPLGVASEIWPHGRWRMDFTGRADHAGTTALDERVDPVLAMAEGVLAVRRAAEELGVLGTVGRLRVHPGAVNAIAASASLWIDGRGADPELVRRMIARVEEQLAGTAVEESWTAVTPFDRPLTQAVSDALGGDLPVLPSGAGHDAGVLALAGVPTAMLFVRNPTGVSHAPEEHAEEADVQAGIAALVAVMRARA